MSPEQLDRVVRECIRRGAANDKIDAYNKLSLGGECIRIKEAVLGPKTKEIKKKKTKES